ncbi:MAG: hypothetical protein R3242_05010 [Akkermansiaceae bacterium]|nr:hypothetical protein [Akkermansiaceae bacterium]
MLNAHGKPIESFMGWKSCAGMAFLSRQPAASLMLMAKKCLIGLTALAVILLGAASLQAASKPNIIFILVDDMGWSESGRRQACASQTFCPTFPWIRWENSSPQPAWKGLCVLGQDQARARGGQDSESDQISAGRITAKLEARLENGPSKQSWVHHVKQALQNCRRMTIDGP